jgi:type II secretory pathway predicted ATPase ExeA
VALRFAGGLPGDQPCVVIPSSRFAKPADLLQAILFDHGADYRGLSEGELRLAVTDRLLTSLAAERPTVVVLDEAQHLSDDVLEEVRLLGNLASHRGPAVFFLLVGQPTLRARLGTSGLAAVAQRLSARCRLDSLDQDESVRFLRDQLTAAGGEPELLDEEAAGVLAGHGQGSPRLLNQLAGLAFALADEAEADAVDVEVALEACSRLGLADDKTQPAVLSLPAKPAPSRRPKKRKSA